MNNKQKFAELLVNITQVREKCEKCIESKEQDERQEILQNMVLTELDFVERKPFFTFCSENYGMYTQMKENRRKRVQAVSICFFVTLYELDLKEAFPKEDIQIEYTLKGFWKMERAISMLEEFIHLQNEWQNKLLWGVRRLAQINREKSGKYKQILEEFLQIKIMHNGWKDIIFYQDDVKFCLNKTNVKLNIVPLCMLLTVYYANVIKKVNWYTKQYAAKGEAQYLQEFQTALTDFMKKYFTQQII